MSLLDRVQRKAEEGQTPGAGDEATAATPASEPEPAATSSSQPEPPTFQLPDVPAGPDLSALTGWQVRHAPPAERAGTAASPSTGARSAAASATQQTPPAIFGPASSSPSNSTADHAAQGAANGAPSPAPRPAPPLMMRTAAGSGTGGEAPPRQSSLLNRTALSRGPLSKPGGGNLYGQLRSKVHQRLVEELAGNAATAPPEQVRQRMREALPVA